MKRYDIENDKKKNKKQAGFNSKGKEPELRERMKAQRKQA